MKAYIGREDAAGAVKEYAKRAVEAGRYELDAVDDTAEITRILDAIPAADVVEVVRCGECTNFRHVKFPQSGREDNCCICRLEWDIPEDGFCFRGERRESE